MRQKTILVTGASGFTGRALCQYLSQHGYRLRQLARRADAEYTWEPFKGSWIRGS